MLESRFTVSASLRSNLSRSLANRALILLGMALYFVFFWVCYVRNVHPLEAHMGLIYFPRPPLEIAAIVLVTLLPAFFLPLVLKRPSQFFCWGMYTIVYVPSLLYTCWHNASGLEILEINLALLAGMAILMVSTVLPTMRMPPVRVSPLTFWGAFALVTVVFYGICVWAFGASLNLVSSAAQIYIQRAVFEQQVRFPANYALAWQSQVLNPLLMAYAVYRRKPVLFLLGFVGQVFFFAVGAMKAMPASAVLILSLVPILGKTGQSFAKRWVWAIVALFGLGALVLGDTRSIVTMVLTDLVLWRVFVGPGYLTVIYFQFFQDNPVAMFGEVKGFSFFFSSPYAFGYKQVLGYTYFGQLTDPNVNLWGDGYANMYVAGVLIESLAAMLALWLLDSVSRGLDVRLVVLACSFQLINLTNGGIFPILLGNGFLLLLLILALYPRDPPSAGVEEAPDGPPLTG